MKVAVVSGGGNEVARRCLDSLLATAPTADFDLVLVRERERRERTLNAALAAAGRADDLLLVGDDVTFTPGWYEALDAARGEADVLGACMLYPGTDVVQDRGYDFADVDGRVTLLPRDRGRPRSALAPAGVRACDALCGCFLYVSASVLAEVPSFPEEGANRWGEILFLLEARRRGARVAVVDHFLYHAGNGTKHGRNPALHSTSWLVERDLWAALVRRHVRPEDVRLRIRTELDPGLAAAVADPTRRALFYGVGTVAERLLAERPVGAPTTLTSGLPEEAGASVDGRTVQALADVDFGAFDLVVVTPLRIGARIAREVLVPRLPADFSGRLLVVEADEGARTFYRGREVGLGGGA